MGPRLLFLRERHYRWRCPHGRWVKISVPASGIYQLTDKLLRNAGFADPSRVKVYGYGGALQPEWLTADYLQTTDEVNVVYKRKNNTYGLIEPEC